MALEELKITKEMRDALREPLPSEAVKQHPTKNFLSSIKAVYVTERLNDVFGIGSWQTRVDPVITEGKMVVVKLIFTIPAYGVYYECYGGNDNADLGDAYKGAMTDGITKVGSYLEIGIDVFKGLHNEPKDEVPKTTLYNHNELGTKEKPLISNIQLKTLINRIKGGDHESYNKAKDIFSFEDKQLRLLNDAKNEYSF